MAAVDKQSCVWIPISAGGRACNGGPLPGRGDLATFEEHRYDALGRRILTRNRSWISCVGPNCDDVIQRTVWDGNQILVEHRATD